MCAPVVLAVNAESVKLLLVYASAQVSRSLGALGVTFEIGLGQWRVALRLTVAADGLHIVLGEVRGGRLIGSHGGWG